MKEEFTAEEKKQAERLVNQIADDGKFDREMRAFHKKLDEMVSENKEENAFFFIAHNENLGCSSCMLGGEGINIIATLVSVCEKDETFKRLVMEAAAFMAQRDLKAKLGISDND